MQFTVTAEVFEWRGPAPYHFVAIMGDDADAIRDVASAVTYGWGMIPVSGSLGGTRFTTSLWPKEGGYYLPLKDAVRRAEGVAPGDVVTVTFEVRAR